MRNDEYLGSQLVKNLVLTNNIIEERRKWGVSREEEEKARKISVVPKINKDELFNSKKDED
jgi:hypothetical protein